jgi:hypothetical protein
LEQVGRMSITQATAFRCFCTECESDETEEPEADKAVAPKSALGEHHDKPVVTPTRTAVGVIERLLFGP